MNRHQLAEAMIKGVDTPGVVESRMHYITVATRKKLCMACALSCALIGQHNGDYQKAEKVYDDKAMNLRDDEHEFSIFADLLKIPKSLAMEVEHKHLQGMPVQQIAAWLRLPQKREVNA